MKIVGPKNVLLLKHLFLLDSWCQAQKKSEVVVTSSRTSICFWLNFFWPLKLPGLVRTKMASYFSGAATGTIQLWSGFLRTLIVQALYESLTHTKFGCVALLGHGISLAQMICKIIGPKSLASFQPSLSKSTYMHTHMYWYIYIYMYIYVERQRIV